MDVFNAYNIVFSLNSLFLLVVMGIGRRLYIYPDSFCSTILLLVSDEHGFGIVLGK